MFINDVIAEIWNPVTTHYRKILKELSGVPMKALYEEVTEEIQKKTAYMSTMNNKYVSITKLATAGCSHCNRSGAFSGCSMCDFSSQHVGGLARINLIRKTDPILYANLLRDSFAYARGEQAEASMIESLSACDIFDEYEFPKEAFDLIFGCKELFKLRPFSYEIVARAPSVTLDKLKKWREVLKQRVAVMLGVEVGNEWVRNHWLNKDVTNVQILQAISQIHSVGWKAYGFLIMGIPGLTSKQSTRLFCDAAMWLDANGADQIVCAPTVRRDCTLQQFIYNHCKNASNLAEQGLTNGAQTGMPDIYMIAASIYFLVRAGGMVWDKIHFTKSYCDLHFKLAVENYAYSNDLLALVKKVQRIVANKSELSAFDCIRALESCKGLMEYIADGDDDFSIESSIRQIGSAVAERLWPDLWESKVSQLGEELFEASRRGILNQANLTEKECSLCI